MLKHTIIFFTIFLAYACETDLNGSLDGNHTVEVQVYHHIVPAPFTEVYLMEDVDEYPGDDLSKYHIKATADISGVAILSKVFPGEHWLYGRGYDGVDSVFGNKPIYIDPRDSDKRSKIIFLISE